MRILLIVPTFNYKYTYPSFLSTGDFPTGFAYISSALRSAGRDVFGLNPNNDTGYRSGYEMLYNRIDMSLREVQPELIGLGGLCTDYKFLKDSIQIIRKLAPDVPVVCGGGIVNNDAEFIFNTLRPDFCIVEEGEEIFVQLVNMIQSGNKDFEQISNLGYWKNGVAKFTKQDFNYIDINKRNFPDYEPFGIKEMLDNYSMATRYLYRYTRQNPRPMPIFPSRSCPFNCTFCVHEGRPRYRIRSMENIMQEIALMYEKYHFNILLIIDELFAVNNSRLEEFCNAVLEGRKTLGWDFEWVFQTHASAKLNRQDLEMAKKSGCYFFSYGLESASPRVLESMNKKTKPSQIKEAIEIADSVGLGFGGNFIFGDLAETPETICETMDFFSRYCLDIHLFLDFIQPYPGSKIFGKCMEKGVFKDKLEFYEHIAERIWNMTSMPDKFWIPWSYLMVQIMKMSRSDLALLQSYPWTKSTTALSCVEETEHNNPIGLYSGKSIYKITVKCPFCNKESIYKELLVATKRTTKEIVKTRKNFQFFKLIKQIILRIIGIFCNKSVLHKKIRRLKLLMKIMIWYLLNFRNPIFRSMIKSLKPILTGTGGGASFDTGCLYCNKRIKINIPIKDSGNRFNTIVKKLLFKTIMILNEI